MLHELALSARKLPADWWTTTQPGGAFALASKERYVADLFWWTSHGIERVEPTTTPPYPDIVWHFVIPVNGWDGCGKAVLHAYLAGPLRRFQEAIRKQFRDMLASIRVSVSPCKRRGRANYSVTLIGSLGWLSPNKRIVCQ